MCILNDRIHVEERDQGKAQSRAFVMDYSVVKWAFGVMCTFVVAVSSATWYTAVKITSYEGKFTAVDGDIARLGVEIDGIRLRHETSINTIYARIKLNEDRMADSRVLEAQISANIVYIKDALAGVNSRLDKMEEVRENGG